MILVERGGREINRLVIIVEDILDGEINWWHAVLMTQQFGFFSLPGYSQVKGLARHLFLGHYTWLKRFLGNL